MEGAQTHKTPMQPLVPRNRSKPMGKTLHAKDFFYVDWEKGSKWKNKEGRDYLSGESPEYTYFHSFCQLIFPHKQLQLSAPCNSVVHRQQTPSSSPATTLQNKSKRNGVVEPVQRYVPLYISFAQNHWFNVCTLAQRSIFMCLYIKFSDYPVVLENIRNSAPFSCILDQVFSKGDHFLNYSKETLWLFEELTAFSVWCRFFPFLMYVRKTFAAGTIF